MCRLAYDAPISHLTSRYSLRAIDIVNAINAVLPQKFVLGVLAPKHYKFDVGVSGEKVECCKVEDVVVARVDKGNDFKCAVK